MSIVFFCLCIAEMSRRRKILLAAVWLFRLSLPTRSLEFSIDSDDDEAVILRGALRRGSFCSGHSTGLEGSLVDDLLILFCNPLLFKLLQLRFRNYIKDEYFWRRQEKHSF